MDGTPRRIADRESELVVLDDEWPDMNTETGRVGLIDRVVLRVMPPNVTDPKERAVAAKAAENVIRQVGTFVVLAGVLLLILTGVLMYYWSSSTRTATAAHAAKIAVLEAETAKLREANRALQQQLEQAVQKQAVLRGEAAALQSQLEALTRVPAVRTPPPPRRQTRQPARPGKISQPRGAANSPVDADLRLRPGK